jgi:hypothetical protein
MRFKRLAYAVLVWRRRRRAAAAITPEFGARIVLREGDKVVRRRADGEIEVTTIGPGGERSA